VWLNGTFAPRDLGPGLRLDRSRRTANGARVLILEIDPKQIRLEAGFVDGVQAMSPQSVRRIPNVLAAVNATFFGFGASEATYGDMRGLGKTYADEKISSGYDSISDRRYFVAQRKNGEVSFGRGGLSEQGMPEDVSGFMGGMGRLFSPQEAPRLAADVASGAFYNRLRADVSNRSFPNTDLTGPVPRTVLGRKADGSLLLVTLGEGRTRSQGAGYAEAALLLRNLGAVEAYTLDGGGSTHLIAPGALETQTDGRSVKSYLVLRSNPSTK
jgi:exopolysaccharide biosynthesis protein